MATPTVSYLWRDQNAHQGFRTGVSLHSHTNQSKETLDFLANLGSKYAAIRPDTWRAWSAARKSNTAFAWTTRRAIGRRP